jgi:LysR family glycine cleavage system transcriptional activator
MAGGPLPPLAAVRVFEAAARHGNFTRAAAELGMTQAAVSYQVRLLEERLGTPLFLRTPRRVTLTEAGARLAPVVSEALEAIRAAFEAVRGDADGALTVSSLHVFAANWLVPRLGAFRAAHPGVSVRLEVGNRLVDFAREEVDVGVRSGFGSWPGLEAHRLLDVRFAPFCGPALLERAGGRLEAPADLLRLPLLSPGDPWWATWFEAAGVPCPGLAERGAIRFDSQQMEGAAAIAGQGVAILTPELWAGEVAAGRLVQPFPAVADAGRSYWLVYPAARRGSRKIRAFRDWLLAEVRRDFPGGATPAGPVSHRR